MRDVPPDEGGAGNSRHGRLRWPPWVGLGLLLLVGWETTATIHQHFSSVQPTDWVSAVDLLRQHHQPGDPVLIAPEWAEPVARAHLRNTLNLDLATISDVDRFARVWQLSLRGADHRWLAALSPARSWTPSRVSLSLFQKTPARVLFDFRDHLADGEVALIRDRRVRCPRRGERFVCPHAAWSWVGVKTAEVNHRPYRCIYAHPVASSYLRISFADVPLGSELVGYTGIDDFANRRRGKSPVYLQLFIDDELRRTIEQPNEGPWQRFEVATPKLAGGRHQIRFEITADDDKHRTFCFHVEARK